jgi:uncharacterized FlaG/YvyC family protein
MQIVGVTSCSNGYPTTPAVKNLNADKASSNFNIGVGADGKPVIKLIDTTTKEVIMQMSSEQAINQSKRFKDYLDRIAEQVTGKHIDITA